MSASGAVLGSQLFDVVCQTAAPPGLLELLAALHQVGAAPPGAQDLAVARSLAGALELPEGVGGAAAEDYWTHSLAVGVAASGLAASCGLEPGVARAAGLLHDVGKLVLASTLPAQYRSCVLQAISSRALIHQAERIALGMDHASVGGCVLHTWRVPGMVVTAVSEHHRPPQLGRLSLLGRIVQMANAVATAAGLTLLPRQLPTFISSLGDVFGGLLQSMVEDQLAELRSLADSLIQLGLEAVS